MYKVDIENKKLVKIPVTSFGALNLKERFDIQEWINGTPEILGEDLLVIGQAGRYLSNISQFLTKKSNPHLRQSIEFETDGAQGETKNNYHIVSEYRGLIQQVLEETARVAPEDLQANQRIRTDVM